MNDWTFDVIIDELVLYGAAVIDRDRFRALVERELIRILEQEGGLSLGEEAGNAPGILSIPHVSLSSAQAPEATQLARVIHKAIKR
jgi:hypothetical protein